MSKPAESPLELDSSDTTDSNDPLEIVIAAAEEIDLTHDREDRMRITFTALQRLNTLRDENNTEEIAILNRALFEYVGERNLADIAI